MAPKEGNLTQTGVASEHWELSGRVANQAIALAILIYVMAFFLFFAYARSLNSKILLIDAWVGTPLGVALALPMFALHEALHGLGYLWMKVKPKYGFIVVGGTPAFYTTAPGHWMTRLQFITVAILPIIGINIIGLLSMLFLPRIRCGLITALAIHLSGCAGDIFFLWKVFHLSKRTLFQDTMHGFDYRPYT